MPTLSAPPARRAGKSVHPLCFFATALALVLAVALVLPTVLNEEDPPLAQTPSPSPTMAPPTPIASAAAPTPSSVPTPGPVSAYDFSIPAPEREAAGADYFSDAVFIGDSRTDGLKLYGGVEGAEFIEHTGITVFEVGKKKAIRINGEKYTVLEALAMKQYGKVYVMLGVNELGYYDDDGFAREYAGFVDQIRALQPGAILYIQNLVAIHPEKAKANNQPYYVTNEQIAVYNGIIAAIAAEKHTVLVDVNAALVGEDGILPREGTTDGVHFTKDYCVRWYDYLKSHTADADAYWAGQTTQ